jgi:hypothetical protein
LAYTIDKESANPADNKYIVPDQDRVFYVNVASFMTLVHFESDQYHQYDLREPVRKVSFPDSGKMVVNPTTFVNNPSSWKNIPMPPSHQQQQQQRHVQQNPFSQQANRNYPVRASKSVNIGMGGRY